MHEIADDLAARDPNVELSQMMGMPCIKSGGKMVIGYERSGEMVFRLPDDAEHEKAPRVPTAPSSSTRPARESPSRSRCRGALRSRERVAQARHHGAQTPALAEPAAGFLVPVDDGVLAAFQDHVEVPPVHRPRSTSDRRRATPRGRALRLGG